MRPETRPPRILTRVAPLLAALVPESAAGASGESAQGGGLIALVEAFAGSSVQASFAANLDFLQLKALQMIYVLMHVMSALAALVS